MTIEQISAGFTILIMMIPLKFFIGWRKEESGKGGFIKD